MNIIVPSIVEVSMNKIVLWICVDVDDWTAERAIIVSNSLGYFENFRKVYGWHPLDTCWNLMSPPT